MLTSLTKNDLLSLRKRISTRENRMNWVNNHRLLFVFGDLELFNWSNVTLTKVARSVKSFTQNAVNSFSNSKYE